MAMQRDDEYVDPTMVQRQALNTQVATNLYQPPQSWTGGSPTFDERAGGASLGGSTYQPPPPSNVAPLPRTVPSQPAPQPTAPTNPAWNTDGYATPQYTATAAAGHPMAGWSRDKWADQNHQTPKYVVGRILSQFQPTTQGLAQALPLLQQAYPGLEFNGKDKIRIPGGGWIDVLQNAGMGGTGWRFGTEEGERNAAMRRAAVGGAGAGAGVGGGSGAGGALVPGGLDPNLINSQIAKFLAMDPSNVTRNDPDIAPAAQAHDAALQRSRRMRQSAMAERAGAEGFANSGSFDADVASSYEDMGREQGAYEGQLINQKMQERRAQIMQALQLGGTLLDSQMRQRLQKELAEMDDATRRFGITTQDRQFNDRLGYDTATFEAEMNRRSALDLLGY